MFSFNKKNHCVFLLQHILGLMNKYVCYSHALQRIIVVVCMLLFQFYSFF